MCNYRESFDRVASDGHLQPSTFLRKSKRNMSTSNLNYNQFNLAKQVWENCLFSQKMVK